MHVLVPLLPALLLLAGCAAPDDPKPDVPSEGDQLPDGTGGENDTPFAPQQGHDKATDDDLPGIVVAGDMEACDQGFCIHAEAHNEGGRTYHVSSICVSPWSDRMERDGQHVQHTEWKAHCAAFGTEPFAPGQDLAASFSWNETTWNDQRQRLEPAPQGAYQWIVSFALYEEADGGGRHDLELTFTVVVGAT